MRKLILLLTLAAAQAHAVDWITFIPNTIGPEFIHQSHFSQHFGEGTDYGSDALALTAHWDLPKNFYVDISEAVSLNARRQYQGYENGGATMYGYGEIMGPREQFIARVGYNWRLK